MAAADPSNAFLDVRRRQKRGRRVPLPDDLAGTSRPASYWLEVAEQIELLQIALRELSETTRTVFHLRRRSRYHSVRSPKY